MQILSQNPQISTTQNCKQQNPAFKANILIKSSEGLLRFKKTPDLLIGIQRKDIPEFGNIIYVKSIQTNSVIGSLGTGSKLGKLSEKIKAAVAKAEADTTDKTYEVLV